MARVTSYDVAARAGVSQSAVSRAFAPNGKVAASTRAKVLKAASELGYKPNALARSLITGRSGIVAVMASEITGRFYPEVVQYLSAALDRAGLKTLLFFTDGKIEKVQAVLSEVSQYQVDAVIATTQFAPDKRELIRAMGKPLVLLNRIDPEGEFKSVACDQNQGAASLASALTRAGRSKIALLTGNADNFVARHRLFGAMDALGTSHYQTFAGDFSYRSGRDQAAAIFNSGADTVMCLNDSMAIGVLDGLDRLGLKAPEDLWVTGFDGTYSGGLGRYDLTTWEQPLSRMVDAAVALLVSQLQGEVGESELIEGSLRVGATAPVAPA